MAPPPNDNDFTAYGEDAFQISCRPGTVTVHDSNFGATKQVGEPDFDGTVGGHSVWWWWTSPGNGTVTIQAHPDYVNGTPLTSPLLLVYDCDVDCDYDHPVAQGHGSVTFTAKQAVDYIIGIDGAAGQEGDFALTLARPSSPANDLQALAEVLAGNSGSTSGSTNWACTDDDDPSGFFNVWYKWTPSVGGWAKLTQTLVDALGSNNRGMAVYRGSPGAWVPITETGFPISTTAGSAVDCYFPITAGETYYIIVSGYKSDGTGLNRFDLDWFAAMDLADVTPADVVVGPAVSTNTVIAKEPTPGGTWFRFELEHVSGTLPTHEGTAPGYLGLIELEDDTGTVCCRVRLAGDHLEARGTGDSWFSLGRPATLGPSLSKVRLEIYSRKLDDGTFLNSYFRVNGVPAAGLAGSNAPTARYVKTVRYGCLWNGGGDTVQVRIKNVGIRVDPDFGPWCSIDAADKGVTFLWGGEGGEIGRSSGGTDWINAEPSASPTIVPAPGAGVSPASRYGNALDCSTGGVTIARAVSVPLGFSMRAPGSIYFYVSDYPDSAGSIAQVTDGDPTHRIDVVLTPTGVLQVFMQGLQVGTIRQVSLNRWHHLELHVDALSPRWPTKVRLNGVAFGPYTFTPFGIPSVTRRFVPGALVAGNVSGAHNFGLAIKDLTVYRQTAYPLGGQTIRKRVPDGVGTHDANVDEWDAGSNQQTPVTDGDAIFDYSGYAVDSYDPPDWLHNLHFQNTVSPDDPLHKIKVQLATLSPPAGVSGEKVLSYLSTAGGVSSGAYTPIPPPAIASPHRYLVEAWIYKAAGGDGSFSSENFPVFLQGWPWHDVVAASYGGWFKFSEDAFQISGFAASEFGFKHTDASSHLYQVGPITIWEDYVYEPRATGFWQSDDDGATYTSIQNVDGSSFSKIQEWPPAAGGKVVGVGPATPGWDTPASPAGNADHHLEYTLQDDTSVGAPIMAARFYVRGRGYDWQNRSTNPSDGSSVYPSRATVESGAHGSPILYAQDVSGAERRWMPGLFVSRGGLAVGARGHDSYMLPTAPGDAAWTPSLWNALRARLGFPVAFANPNGIVAEPVVEAFALEVLVPEPELPPEGGGPILGFSFRADPRTTPPASPTTEATVHLAGIEFRT